MKRLPQFDVFKAGMIGGTPLGAYLETIGARDHTAAKGAAEALYRGIAHVVVLPAGKSPPRTNRDFSRLTQTDRRSRGGRARSTPPRTRP